MINGIRPILFAHLVHGITMSVNRCRPFLVESALHYTESQEAQLLLTARVMIGSVITVHTGWAKKTGLFLNVNNYLCA